ncbi:hypothetical protein [Bacillus sp. RIT694]|uniref:hypothetical protein n=1 Tax=Bacillus sp. RIT694 TaxID=2666190 RepID=UPI0012AC62C3|nr:hypothetical protein [Bacillus sp. RIT694]MRS25591.1 hypothetical protein [Bacillus sp. RIT694]
MEFNWIEEEYLQQKYQVLGSFYNVELSNRTIKCRNDLHILDKDFTDYDSNLKPDLLMIMMNPGKSTPADADYIPPCYSTENAPHLIKDTQKVETIPDRTQYQIMRIMWNMGYKHSRVINISDLRNPISTLFKRDLEQVHVLNSIHSIFSELRREELEGLFSELKDDSVVFKAWGIDIVNKSATFKNLVNKCIISLQTINQQQKGLQGPSVYHTRHPLPFPYWSKNRQKIWLTNAGILFKE